MTVADALSDSGLDRVDAEILLASTLGRDRSWLFAHAEDALTSVQTDRFRALAARRRTGEPVAYIVGEKEFFGRPFRVTPATLIPRPATELLVEQVLRALAGEGIERVREIDAGIVAWSECEAGAATVGTVVDVGTGSGCIAVTLARERSDLRLIATDLSPDALAIAGDNARRHGVADRVSLVRGDGLAPVADLTEPFLLVSNPPYVPDETVLEQDVAGFEPHAALFAGPRGTNVLAPLVAAARAHAFCRGFIVECRDEQAAR